MSRVAMPSEAGARTLWLGLVGLNVVCVLEPLVGVVWQACLFRVAGGGFRWFHPVLLGAGLWLVYAADRALDARSRRRPDTIRHSFFARHLGAFIAIGALVASSALALALLTLNVAEWMSAGSVFAVALAYLLVVHPLAAAKPVKKALAASVYALGVGAFVWPNSSDNDALLIAQLGFALLAGCNLAVISTIEVASTRTQTRTVLFACLSLGVVALVVGPSADPHLHRLGFSIATSAFALALLLLPSTRHRELSHALADLALFLPLLPAT